MEEHKETIEHHEEKKKKLLIATDNFLPRWDGIARFLSEMIPRLAKKYDITVLAPDFGTHEDPHIKLVKIPLMKFIKIGDFVVPQFQLNKIRKIIKETDIVFTQTIGPIGLLALNAAKKYKKPVASFIHSIEWELASKAINNPLLKKYSHIFVKRIAKRIYNKSNLLIMPSHSVSDLFLWNNIRTKSEVVNLGVDTNKFRPVENIEARKTIRASLNISEDEIVIGYHGRISREKDIITLLRAFTRIQQNGHKVKLLIVGDGIESIKKQLASRNGVILAGSKNNPVPYLQAMDIYCVTSLTETTCLSALEAMSCGLPVISTEVGFIKDYIRNNINGMFFQKQNPYHLAKHINRLVLDEKLRMKIGESARKMVVERFSWDKTAKGIEEALSSLR